MAPSAEVILTKGNVACFGSAVGASFAVVFVLFEVIGANMQAHRAKLSTLEVADQHEARYQDSQVHRLDRRIDAIERTVADGCGSQSFR